MIQQPTPPRYSLKQLHVHSPHLTYSPEPVPDKDNWYHPILGYPKCPLIGRYNKGEYRIGEVALHLEFTCTYDEDIGAYFCGQRPILLPEVVLFQMRNIPELIPHNVSGTQKNPPPPLPPFPTSAKLQLSFLVSFGHIGKDFLNYLNHTYIFPEDIFFGEKLLRTTHHLPIFAYLPQGAGLEPQEVERGISVAHWRVEFMSVHLKAGAPAFSPNNMRLGVEGGVKVSSNAKGSKKETKGKCGKEKINQKGKKIPKMQEQSSQALQEQKEAQVSSFWEQIEKNTSQMTTTLSPSIAHEFVHFYTGTLQQHSHRVNYHWHIDSQHRQQILRELIRNMGSVEELLDFYKQALGEDYMTIELSRLLAI